jgi:protein disulfide-isomerase
VDVGSTYAAVIAEKGQPASRLEHGDTVILTYPDMVIKLQAGTVASIQAVQHQSAPVEATPAPATTAEATVAAPLQWTIDYTAALEQAKTEHRRVFLLFTGSDWNPESKSLAKEVLSTPAFQAYAQNRLVLVKIDFPRGLRQRPGTVQQNRNLQKQYGVTAFPTVIVLNSSGDVIGQLSYMPGGPVPFIGRLKAL